MLDYWQNKFDRLLLLKLQPALRTVKNRYPAYFKYAFHYLKTYFESGWHKKEIITAEFRKIYRLLAPDQRKDRSKHSHHAKDAAVLTFIPTAAKDAILEKYYEAKRK